MRDLLAPVALALLLVPGLAWIVAERGGTQTEALVSDPRTTRAASDAPAPIAPRSAAAPTEPTARVARHTPTPVPERRNAPAPQVFERLPADGRPTPDPRAHDRTVYRERFARIVPERLASGEPLEWNVFDDTHYRVEPQTIETHGADGAAFTWSGRVAGDPGSLAMLRVEGGRVTGNLALSNGELYAVDTLEPGVQRVLELNASAYPDCGSDALLVARAAEPPPTHGAPATGAAPPPAGTDPIGPEVIDVLLAYTPSARDTLGGTAAIESRLSLLVDWANGVYQNSNATQRLRAVAIVEVAYDDSHGLGLTALNDATVLGDGELEELHTLRSDYGADMVSLITAPNNVCGIAWIAENGANIHWYEAYMFSVVNVNCTTNPRTFTHELGHNQGGYHDPATSMNQGMTQQEIDAVPFPNSFGHVADGNAFHTVMAYGSACGWCPSLQQFSNKDIDFQGTPTGDDRSNVHETLEATYLTIAAFRTPLCTEDADGDGVCDDADNCVDDANPEQLDSDSDGYGNLCDADYDGDGTVGTSDFSDFLASFGLQSGDAGYDARADHTGNDSVDATDYDIFLDAYGGAPGPSGLSCAGTSPCP